MFNNLLKYVSQGDLIPWSNPQSSEVKLFISQITQVRQSNKVYLQNKFLDICREILIFLQ